MLLLLHCCCAAALWVPLLGLLGWLLLFVLGCMRLLLVMACPADRGRHSHDSSHTQDRSNSALQTQHFTINRCALCSHGFQWRVFVVLLVRLRTACMHGQHMGGWSGGYTTAAGD